MIKRQTLDFLTAIAENNHRDWFLSHKDEYEAARENIIDFAAAVITELSKIDNRVDPQTDPKKCVMRIYRDIRFSKDKTPYKSFLGIHKLTGGRYTGGIGYYLHIEPGKSFVAGGYWLPEGEYLKAIRQEIDYNAAELKKIIDAPKFKKLFCDFRIQEQLKTVPAGYSADNENIDLLKLKSFIAERQISDADLQKGDIVKRIAELFKEIYPLNLFLENAIAQPS